MNVTGFGALPMSRDSRAEAMRYFPWRVCGINCGAEALDIPDCDVDYFRSCL